MKQFYHCNLDPNAAGVDTCIRAAGLVPSVYTAEDCVSRIQLRAFDQSRIRRHVFIHTHFDYGLYHSQFDGAN
jgi:hypothetical protein